MKYGLTVTGKTLHLRGENGYSLCGKPLVAERGRLLSGEQLCERCQRASASAGSAARRAAAEERRREEEMREKLVHQRQRAALASLRAGIELAGEVGQAPLAGSDGALLGPGHIRHRLGVYQGQPV